MDADVTDNSDLNRFEIRMNGELAGFVAYRPLDGVLAFTHAEVDPARRGAGVAAQLVGGAFALVRASGGRVRPECSYVVSFARRHPEYADVLEAGWT